MPVRAWFEVAFYVVATVGCGMFFTWLVKRIDVVAASLARLRAHEHTQNNALTQMVLLSHQHADDLGTIRHKLGCPRDGA